MDSSQGTSTYDDGEVFFEVSPSEAGQERGNAVMHNTDVESLAEVRTTAEGENRMTGVVGRQSVANADTSNVSHNGDHMNIANALKDLYKEIQTLKQAQQSQATGSQHTEGQGHSRMQLQPQSSYNTDSGQECSYGYPSEHRQDVTRDAVRSYRGYLNRNANSNFNGTRSHVAGSQSDNANLHSQGYYGDRNRFSAEARPLFESHRGDGMLHQRPRPRAGDNVKIPEFTGKKDWQMWIARFEAIAHRYQWGEDERLDHLLPRLEGQAGQFAFVQLPPPILNNYREFVHEMNNRFQAVETSRAYTAKLSRRNQKQGETAEEYAAELKMLYDKAHGYRDRRTRDEDLVRGFHDGLKDDEARFEVEYHKEPLTIDEAVFHVVNFIQTRNCYYNDRRNRSTRRAVTAADPEHEELETQILRVPANKNSRFKTQQYGKQNENRQGLSEANQTQEHLIQQILARLESLEEKTKPADNKSRSQRKQSVECFNCHKQGHFARECQNPSFTQRRQNHQEQQPKKEEKQNQQSSPLNSQGPSLAARGRSQ